MVLVSTCAHLDLLRRKVVAAAAAAEVDLHVPGVFRTASFLRTGGQTEKSKISIRGAGRKDTAQT